MTIDGQDAMLLHKSSRQRATSLREIPVGVHQRNELVGLYGMF